MNEWEVKFWVAFGAMLVAVATSLIAVVGNLWTQRERTRGDITVRLLERSLIAIGETRDALLRARLALAMLCARTESWIETGQPESDFVEVYEGAEKAVTTMLQVGALLPPELDGKLKDFQASLVEGLEMVRAAILDTDPHELGNAMEKFQLIFEDHLEPALQDWKKEHWDVGGVLPKKKK